MEIQADAASALIANGNVRAEMTKRAGRLYDAVTLIFTDVYLARVAASLDEQVLNRGGRDYSLAVYDKAMDNVVATCRDVIEYEVPTPIPTQ